jgi:hypothetical protein
MRLRGVLHCGKATGLVPSDAERGKHGNYLPCLWGSDRVDVSVKLIGTQCGRELFFYGFATNRTMLQEDPLLTVVFPSICSDR